MTSALDNSVDAKKVIAKRRWRFLIDASKSSVYRKFEHNRVDFSTAVKHRNEAAEQLSRVLRFGFPSRELRVLIQCVAHPV